MSDDGIISLNGARLDRRELFIAATFQRVVLEREEITLRPHNKP